MNDKLKRKEKGKKNMNNSAEHKHHNRTEVRAVKREIVYSLQNLNKSILGLFGLEEGDNVGMMVEPSARDLDMLMKELEDIQAYYGGLVK